LTPLLNTGNWVAISVSAVKLHLDPHRELGPNKQEAIKLARPELGEKRRCLSCETKFYDLNKDPAICPKCGVVFELQVPEKIEPVPEAKKEEKTPAEDDSVSSVDPDTISLEDADEDDGVTVDGEEIPDDIPEVPGVDDDETNSEVDDAFLDDDDDNDNMSDLVKVTKDDGDDS